VILLDDGWSAASSWEARIKRGRIDREADNDRRGVALRAVRTHATSR